MKRTGTIIIFYIIAIVFILFLGHFFKSFISQYYSEIKAKFIASIIFRGIFVFLSFFLLKKLNLFTFSGLNSPFKLTHPTALIVPVAIIGLVIANKIDLYLSIESSLLLMFLFNNILIGVFEEISMRGILLPLFLKLFKFKKKSIYKAVIISSLIFGVLHYMNVYMKKDYGFDMATSQVIFAFCIGVFFCGLFLRTGNIFSSMLIHSVFNIAFGTTLLKGIKNNYKPEVGREVNNLTDLFPTLILYLIIITIGLLMVKFSNKESFIKKLNTSE